MKKIFLILFLLSVSSKAYAGITYVQTSDASMKRNTSSNTIASTAMTVSQGSLLVAVVATWTTTTSMTISSVADGIGNTFTAAVTDSTDADRRIAIYYKENCVGGSSTVTATFSGSAGVNQITVIEYRGVKLTSPLDVTQTQANFTSQTPSFSMSPAASNALYVGEMHSYADRVITAGDNGRSELETFLAISVSDIVNASGAQTLDWDTTTSTSGHYIGATFKPEASGLFVAAS